MRSVFIPLERVDRFDVVWEHGVEPGIIFERLVLLTRDGTKIPVLTGWWPSGRNGLPLRVRALQLNNHILPTWRAASDPRLSADLRLDSAEHAIRR